MSEPETPVWLCCTGQDRLFQAEDGGNIVVKYVVFANGNGRASRGSEVMTVDPFAANTHVATMEFDPVPCSLIVEEIKPNDAKFVVTAPVNVCDDEGYFQIVRWVLENGGCVRRKSNKQPFQFDKDFLLQKPKTKPKQGWQKWGIVYFCCRVFPSCEPFASLFISGQGYVELIGVRFVMRFFFLIHIRVFKYMV